MLGVLFEKLKLPKERKRWLTIVVVLALGFWLIPFITLFYLACGWLDVLRNDNRGYFLFARYFTGNGFTTWLMAPFNLFFDLLSYRNRKIWRIEDFGEEAQAEINEVLTYFKSNTQKVLDDINAEFGDSKRAMMIYRWFGLKLRHDTPDLNGSFKHVRTIAVSVFEGQESTNQHFGPHRLTLRVLYNLTPVNSDQVFIEVGEKTHVWRDDPLFIFDDTLMHRSVNDDPGRRSVVFLDVMRPSPYPKLLQGIEALGAPLAQAGKNIFYRRWDLMTGTKKTASDQ